jgi:hypothetical protein
VAGCGDDEESAVPPASELNQPSDLLVTQQDIEDAKPDSPYGRLLSWWQAVQFRNISQVRTFYAKPPPVGALNSQLRQIEGLGNSRPYLFEERGGGDRTKLFVVFRLAFRQAGGTRTNGAGTSVGVQDSPTNFQLVQVGGAWKLSDNTYLENRVRAQRTMGPAK